jgi:hypothetical protein
MPATPSAVAPKQHLNRVDSNDVRNVEKTVKEVEEDIKELFEWQRGAVSEQGGDKKVVIEVGAAGAAAFVLVTIATTVLVLRYGCNLCLQSCR